MAEPLPTVGGMGVNSGPRRGEDRVPVDDGVVRGAPSGAMLQRVRALLAKAESTTFPEEAEALTGEAQELMARRVRAGRSVDREGRPRTRSFRQSFLLAYADLVSIAVGEALEPAG